MTITLERLQELLARASMAETHEISKENMDEYREILQITRQALCENCGGTGWVQSLHSIDNEQEPCADCFPLKW